MARQTIDFTVTGEQTIHCAGCEQRIQNALRRLDGVEGVQASHKTQEVLVTIDPGLVSSKQIQDKLEQIGYEAELR